MTRCCVDKDCACVCVIGLGGVSCQTQRSGETLMALKKHSSCHEINSNQILVQNATRGLESADDELAPVYLAPENAVH